MLQLSKALSRINWKIACIAISSIVVIGIIVFVFIKPASIYRLHRDKISTEVETLERWGVDADYVEWKITPEGDVVWRIKVTNTTDEPKNLYISFQLVDKDEFVIGKDEKGIFNPESIKLYEEQLKSYQSPWLPADGGNPFSDAISDLRHRQVLLYSKSPTYVEGKFKINEKMGSSAYKSYTGILVMPLDKKLEVIH